jgi:hypothetical protein
MGHRNEWGELTKAITNSGWSMRKCRHGLYVYPVDRTRRPVTVPGTPGDYRSFRNARADVRRAALPV